MKSVDSAPANTQISAMILAGGRALRMDGCDKGLVDLQSLPMIAHVIRVLKPQLELIRINANRSHALYAELAQQQGISDHPSFEIISDSISNFQGPLAGIARGLQHCPSDWLLICPCDTPFLPTDLVSRMLQQVLLEQTDIAVAHDGRRLQPVVSLIKRELYPSLQTFLAGDDRKIDRWYAKHPLSRVDFSDQPDAFLNINSLREIQMLENQAV